MKKQIGIILCLMFGIVLVGLGGCMEKEKPKETGKYIYYFNTDEKALEKLSYANKDTDTEKEVKSMLKALKKSPEAIELQPAIPKEVKVTETVIVDKQLELHFNEAYLKMKRSEEVLCRAAIVQTMVQVEGIDFVSFYVGEEPLKDRKGDPVGLMRAEDFVQNTGNSLSSYQTTTLNLYFADKDGTALENEKISNVHYNANTSIEKLVVEQLMKGPSSDKMNPTIPKVTKLLGVSVRDGICYVNFDSSFLTEGYNQKPEVPIYSIVNSILENGNATQVQILIDGASDHTFKDSVKLNSPLEWNAELIKEKKE